MTGSVLTVVSRCVIRTFDKIIPSLSLWRLTSAGPRPEDRNTGAMPVGCSRAESHSQCLESGEERRGSSSVRVMENQHTILLQIFPRPRDPGQGGQGGQGGRGPLACPTCKPFSETCCQAEAGWSVLSSLVRSNRDNVWNINLVKTITRLRYQVSVGPG